MNAATPATSTNSESKVLGLPTEIQVRILSELPAKEIQSCRRVCKHIRDIIDEKSNATLLFGAAQARERSRLSQDLADATDFTNVDFLDALARWLKRRGIWADEEPLDLIAMTFGEHWAEQGGRITGDPLLDDGRDEIVLMCLAEALISLHTNTHFDLIVDSAFTHLVHGGGITNVDDLIKCALYTLPGSAEVLGRCGINESKIRQWGNEIENNASCLSAPIASASPLPAVLRRPVWNLTSWYGFEVVESFLGGDDGMYAKHRDGIVGVTWLSEVLHIDQIPSSYGYLFAYCSRTQWAGNKLKSCAEGETMSELEKTAILEDMFLF